MLSRTALGASPIRRFLVAAMVLGALAAPAAAHPHIFVEARATIVFGTGGAVTAIRHSWTFDEEFSAWAVQGLDADGDGNVSSAEMQDLAVQNLEGLAEYSYYTAAGEAAHDVAFGTALDPRLSYENGRTTFTFAVPVEPAYGIHNRLQVAIGDPEYYVAITIPDIGAVTLENAPDGCVATLEAPKEVDPKVLEQLYALPPDVTALPPELAQALRGSQGGIAILCPPGVSRAVAATAEEAVTVAAIGQALPFNGPPPEPGLMLPRTGVLGWIADLQRQFYATMSDALGRLREDGNAFWVLGGLSFLYGVFHAAGPGHGKVIISSYVLASTRQLSRGVLLSFASAMLQSAVAVAFVLAAAGVLQLTSAAMSAAANWIGVASYALIALLGAWLVIRHLFLHGHGHPAPQAHHHDAHEGHEHDHGHTSEAHAHHHEHAITPGQLNGSWREQLAVVLGVGLRPCSGALVILVFALSQDLLLAGIAAVFLMGLGTAVTVAVLAAIAVGAKGGMLRLAGPGGGGGFAVAVWWLELAGAAAVLGFGLLFLLASL